MNTEKQDYIDFLLGKVPQAEVSGFDPPSPCHHSLFPHQMDICEWAIRGGRRAIFASFGLGKTRMHLQLAKWVCEKTKGSFLIICPLGVRQEFTQSDGPAMGMRLKFIRRNEDIEQPGIYVTNYESVRDGKIDVNAFQGQAKEVGKTEFLNKFAKAYEDRITGRNNGRGYQTSLDALNDTLGGIYTKQVMIIAGKPTSGKSILAGQLLWDLANDGVPVSFLSLELPGEKVMERTAIYVSAKPAIAISKPIEFARANDQQAPSKLDLIKLQNVIRQIESVPFQVDDSCGQYIGQVVAKIRRHHRLYGTKVFAVDYVQIIKSSRGKNASKEEETADISHTFQALAKELDVAILLLSQLNKDNQTKYASAIFEDADTMLTIIIDEDTNYHRAIGIKKDRHNGKTGEILPIVMDKSMLKFIPKPDNWDSKAPETGGDAKKNDGSKK